MSNETTDNNKVGIYTDLMAGILFAVVGGIFCIMSLTGLKIGTAFRMGPGFFPAAIGGTLALLGIAIAIKGLRNPPTEVWIPANRRALIVLPIGMIGFGLMVRPLGLALALLYLCLLAGLASGEMTFRRSLVVALVMTSICIGIFSFGLGINTPLIGDWFR